MDLGQRALTLQEAERSSSLFLLKNKQTNKQTKNGVLMRKWRPPDAPSSDYLQIVHQIVVPKVYHREVISIAHMIVPWQDI